MSENHPQWYERYETVVRDPEVYFVFEGENAGRFSWDTSEGTTGLTDPDGIRDLPPEEVIAILTMKSDK